MSILTFPANIGAVEEDWQPPVAQFLSSSPVFATTQAIVFPASRWEFKQRFEVNGDNLRLLKNFLERLRGRGFYHGPCKSKILEYKVGEGGFHEGFTDGTKFTDGTGFTDDYVLTANANAAIGATSVQVGQTANINRLKEGFRFGYSDYLYKIEAIDTTSQSPDTVLTIWPPLRTAINSGEALEWKSPRSIFRLASQPAIPIRYGLMSSIEISGFEVTQRS